MNGIDELAIGIFGLGICLCIEHSVRCLSRLDT